MIKQELKTIIKYLYSNILMSIVLLYIVLAVILKSFSNIDITIPCLWTSIFGMKCPGCGLTSASVELMHFHICEAFNTNPLIFIIIPAFVYYIASDYYSFRKKAQ